MTSDCRGYTRPGDFCDNFCTPVVNGCRYGKKPTMKQNNCDIPRLVWRGGGNRQINGRRQPSSRDINSPCHSVHRHLSSSKPRTVRSVCFQRGFSSLSGLLLVFFILFCKISVLNAQCAATTDCHPRASGLVTQDVVNANPARSLEVSSTCSDATAYRKNSLTFDDTLYYCWANNNSHPAISMLDRSSSNFENFQLVNPQLQSYWQSENTIVVAGANPQPQIVMFNLTDRFLIRYVRVIFLSPHILTENDNSDMRPLAMVFEKFDETINNWAPLRYYAINCSIHFPGVPRQNVDGTGPSFEAHIAVCFEKYFGGDTRTFTGWGYGRQEVQFAPSREFDPEFGNSYVLQQHFTTNMVRLRLVKPADDQPLSSYYAIADVEVSGHCSCYGHASGCSGANEAQCLCQHGTQGANCQECQALFNNKPWRMGANNLANACEDCGCNNHATSCRYDGAKAYGVCDNCTLNTAGDKCQLCVDFYYVSPLKDLYANGSLPNPGSCSGYNGTEYIAYSCDSWCIPCNCNLEGSSPGSGYNCQSATGQCFCKVNVQARACDECRDGFWNLTAINPAGCRACACDSRGTIDNSNLCDKFAGDCICKNNTQSRNCGECKDGFFALSLTNPDGCTPCDCDPGASFNILCPRSNGICPCRPQIGGRTCKVPTSGRYVPAIDHLTYDAEFAVNATAMYTLVEKTGHGELNGTVTGRGYVEMPPSSNLQFLVTVPKTHQYSVVLRYASSGSTWSNTQVVFKLTNPTGSGITQYGCGGPNLTVTQPQTVSAVLAQAVEGREVVGPVCLAANLQYTATVTTGSPSTPGSKLLLDSLVLLPNIQTLAVWNNLDAEGQTATTNCYTLAIGCEAAARVNASCSIRDYSVMAELYNGAQPCSCVALGSAGVVCDPNGGQCPCKPGVMLLGCSQCKVDHYGYQSGVGCTACNCHPQASVRTACNETGLCDCKANVTNIKCDACIPEHYGLVTGNGCVPCTCHANYSLHNQCMDSGQCYCKPGVGGLFCDQCADGFYNLTADGCSPCGCHVDGSAAGLCDKQSGVCTCKVNVQGEKCDQCRDGFFGLGQWGPDGCLQCMCSGHSGNCSSAGGYRYAVVQSTWNLLEGITALERNFGAIDQNGGPVDISSRTKIVGTTAERVMRIINEGNNIYAEHYYYNATPMYLANKRGGYGLDFTVALTLSYPPPPVNTTIDFINSTTGDIIIQGRWTYYKLVAWLPYYPNETIATFTFKLHESDWRINSSTGAPATYTQVQDTIADISSMHIRAKFTNATGAITDLHTFELAYTSVNGTLGGSPNNVETCVCPDGYTGQYCEQCASGFTRRVPSGGPTSECIPCSCNGHQSAENPCHPESGTCSCIHNTTADHCETCVDGYYGDATIGSIRDCRPCLCPGNAITGDLNVFAATCQSRSNGGYVCLNCTEGHGGDHCEYCVNNWYGTPTNITNTGGQCVPCQCNSRADTCDPVTGMCVSCRNNTAGKECEICAPRYFGNAMEYDCKECNCTKLGATGDCDHRTGQCECKPYVTGFECERCEALAFNYSSGLGCEQCDCHAVGSLSRGCNVTSGQCLCQVHVTGRRCDLCEDTYWRINSVSGCDPCQCTALGTKNETSLGKTFGTCDLNSGQCECAVPGIIGGVCDHCAKGTLGVYVFAKGLYFGTYPNCELCGECYDNWARKIDIVGLAIQAEYNKSVIIWTHYDNRLASNVGPILSQIEGNLTDIDSSIATAMDMVNRLNYLRDGFADVMSNVTAFTAVLDTLQAEVTRLSGGLRTNQNFLGIIRVNVTTTRTPYQIESDTLEIQAYHERIYSDANRTWASIQNYTDVITSSNGSAQLLQARVNEALSQLSLARRDRVAAEMIYNGSFSTVFANNTDKLNAIAGRQAELASMIMVGRNQLGQAEILATSANSTANEAEAIRAAKAGNVEAKLEAAETTMYNATQAQLAGQTAQTAATNYMNLATTTLADMTDAMEGISFGRTALTAIGTEVTTGDALRQNIGRTGLRPFTAMQAITGQIESTTISAQSVAQTFASATAGLRVAEEALNISNAASLAAQQALEQVRGIQSNLQNAKATRTEINRLETSTTNLNNTIGSVLSTVNSKTSNANTLGQTTSSNIDSVTVFMSSIKAGFSTEMDKAVAARVQAQQANASASLATLTHNQNAASLVNLTNGESQRRQVVDSAMGQLQGVDTELKRLEADLAALDAITNLQRMQNEFAAQKSEMQSLSTQLQSLERDIDTLIAQLDSYGPDSATCTHS